MRMSLGGRRVRGGGPGPAAPSRRRWVPRVGVGRFRGPSAAQALTLAQLGAAVLLAAGLLWVGQLPRDPGPGAGSATPIAPFGFQGRVLALCPSARRLGGGGDFDSHRDALASTVQGLHGRGMFRQDGVDHAGTPDPR